MEYVGIAVNTDFSMSRFPALERNLVEKLEARCLILSTIAVNKSFFLLPKCSALKVSRSLKRLARKKGFVKKKL